MKDSVVSNVINSFLLDAILYLVFSLSAHAHKFIVIAVMFFCFLALFILVSYFHSQLACYLNVCYMPFCICNVWEVNLLKQIDLILHGR